MRVPGQSASHTDLTHSAMRRRAGAVRVTPDAAHSRRFRPKSCNSGVSCRLSWHSILSKPMNSGGVLTSMNQIKIRARMGFEASSAACRAAPIGAKVFPFERLNHSRTIVYGVLCRWDQVDTSDPEDKIKKLKNGPNFERFEKSEVSIPFFVSSFSQQASDEGKEEGMRGLPVTTSQLSFREPRTPHSRNGSGRRSSTTSNVPPLSMGAERDIREPADTTVFFSAATTPDSSPSLGRGWERSAIPFTACSYCRPPRETTWLVPVNTTPRSPRSPKASKPKTVRVLQPFGEGPFLSGRSDLVWAGRGVLEGANQ
jgi:hypothetical protein